MVKVFKGLWPKSQINVTIHRVVGVNMIYRKKKV